MQFVYTPEGAEPKVWDFDPEKLMSPEAEAIERHTGMRFGEWKLAVIDESMLALHGLLYVLLKRDNPTLKWEQVQFSLSELDFVIPDDDARAIVLSLETAAAAGEELDERQVIFLDQLRDVVGPQLKVAGDDEEGEPEAPFEGTSDDASSTSSPSSSTSGSVPGKRAS